MCGRTVCTLCESNIVKANAFKCKNSDKIMTPEWYDLNTDKSISYKLSYNQTPGQYLPVMVMKKSIDKSCHDSDQRIISGMRFGLIPDWHKTDVNQFKLNTINCRIETIKESKIYSKSLNKGNRCVVLVEGFFEWKTNKDNSKDPYFLYFPQSSVDFKNRDKWMTNESEFDCESGWKGPRLLTIAGLFDTRKCDSTDQKLFSFTIITVESHPKLKWIHNRMPAILESEDDVRDWLDFENVGVNQAIKLLVPFGGLQWHRVSNCVSNAKNNTIDNILPIKETTKQKTIDHWFKSKSTQNKSPKNTPINNSFKSEKQLKQKIHNNGENEEQIEPKRKREEILLI